MILLYDVTKSRFFYSVDNATEDVTASLASNPSVPGPEYFEDGWKNVTNDSIPLYSVVTLRPDGIVVVDIPLTSLPYPSKSMHEGGSVYFPGRSGIGIVQPAKSVLPCAFT